MDTSASLDKNKLEQLKEEIKKELAPPNYQNFWSSVLNAISQKIFKKSIYSSTGINLTFSLILILLILCLNLAISALVSILMQENNSLSLELLPLEVILLVLSTFFVTAYLAYSQNITKEFREYVIDTIQNREDLLTLKKWFSQNSNNYIPLIMGVLFSVFWIFFAPYYIGFSKTGFLGYGTLISIVLNIFPIGTAIYYLYLIAKLPFLMSKLDYHIYSIDPSKSVLVTRLSKLLSKSLLIIGVLAAITTIAMASADLLNIIGVSVIFTIGWIPLLSQFIFNQNAFARIIYRAKWKRIKSIQDELESCVICKKFDVDQNLDKINRLKVFHDQIVNSPDSMINVKTIINLLDSLILPLLALIISSFLDFLNLFH